MKDSVFCLLGFVFLEVLFSECSTVCVLPVYFVARNICPFVVCPQYKSWNPCPFNTDQSVCAAQQTSVSLWKADLVTRQPGDCLAGNTHIKKPKLPASASLIIIFFSVTLFHLFLQMHYFFFCSHFAQLPLPWNVPTCMYFFLGHWNPALSLMEVQNGWAALETVSGLPRMLWICLMSG